MNLVGGYESSDDDNEVKDSQALSAGFVATKATSPNRSATSNGGSTTRSYAGVVEKARTDNDKKGRKGKAKGKGKLASQTARKSKRSTEKRRKIVKSLALSPEIQSALARGDTLGDSDSDEAPDKKPPKIVRQSGNNANDLLSLLPQPSAAISAEQMLLKSKKRRQLAATRAADAERITASEPAQTSNRQAIPPTKEVNPGEIARSPTDATAPGAEVRFGAEPGGGDKEGSDSGDSGGEDLLPNMRAKALHDRAGAGTKGSTSLFTLPSRTRPALAASTLTASSIYPLPGEVAKESKDAPDVRWNSTSSSPHTGGTGRAGGHWGSSEGRGAYVYAGEGLAQATEIKQVPPATTIATNAPAYRHQPQQAGQYPPFPIQDSAFAAAATPAVGQGHDSGSLAGKASRRKGRDMERALARGDLGALGDETPVMDLHQGSNDYNPLRSKPVTAAMKQDQKHIEGSVYDPRTGTTKTTLEPTSLQKRKHQINQLAVQAAGMERDLMERSGASRLTKAQTHAKYGW